MSDDINQLRTELKMLGNQHKRWKEKIPILQDRIRRADAAGMKQAEIADLSGYERDNIRLLCMSPEQREELRRRRRVGADQVALESNPALVAANPARPDGDTVGDWLDANEKLPGGMESAARRRGSRPKRTSS